MIKLLSGFAGALSGMWSYLATAGIGARLVQQSGNAGRAADSGA